MSKNKTEIRIIENPYEQDAVYGGFGFASGFTIKNMIVNSEETLEGNYAFSNVFFNCLRISHPDFNGQYDVGRTVSTIVLKSDRNSFSDAMKETFLRIVKKDISKELFDQAKEETKKAFEMRYKNEAFRAKYKAFEFSDLNKQYRLQDLIFDLENFTYEQFRDIAHAVLTPENLRILLIGNPGEDFRDVLHMLDETIRPEDRTVDFISAEYDPYLVQDAHIMARARQECFVNVERFDFFNRDTTAFAKYLILDFYSTLIRSDNIEIYADNTDASIIVIAEELSSVKALMGKMTEADFTSCKQAVVNKYLYLLKNRPEDFAADALVKLCSGISPEQYLDYCMNMTCDTFEEICGKADYKVTEAQIVMGGNG